MVANLIGQTVRLLEMVQRDRERLMEQQRILEKEMVRDTPSKNGSSKKGKASDIGIVGTSPALQHALQQIGRAHVEPQSLMRISYAVFSLKKKHTNYHKHSNKQRQ